MRLIKKSIRRVNKVTGLALVALAILLGFGNLQGWFRHHRRVEFLHWVLESNLGMPIDAPPAIEFIKKFPPSAGAQMSPIVYVHKMQIVSEGGPPMAASINYIHADGSQTSYVATLDQVREWASESRYPWLAWVLATFGFVQLLVNTVLEWGQK